MNDQNESIMTDAELIQNELLDGGLAELLSWWDASEIERRGDSLYIAPLQLTVRPVVNDCDKQTITLAFYMYSDLWEKQLFEYSAGMGKDTKSAMGFALSSFIFSFMEGMKYAAEHSEPRITESSFAGHTHRWEVYLGNVVGTGQAIEHTEENHAAFYWELLKDDIIKRLGNQTMVYVKIYAAKVGDEIIGECRIDDIAVPELGKKVAEAVKAWGVPEEDNIFVSEKQFFFLVQQPETLQDTPYHGIAGYEKMKSDVTEYLRLFQAMKTQEDFDNLVNAAKQVIDDPLLCEECFSFLPEICARIAFQEQISFGDEAYICIGNSEPVKVFLSQITDYQILCNVIDDLFSNGVFGDATNEIYENLVLYSSIFNVISQMREKGETNFQSDFTQVFNLPEDFMLQ